MQRVENILLGDNSFCRICLVTCHGSRNVKTFCGGLLLWLKNVRCSKECVSKYFDKKFKSRYDRFWLDEINQKKFDQDGYDHNKLWFYNTLKGTFCPEPYI